ncbi:MAG: RNA 2',3'-cyclic phosphodiesterase [Candidatus Staskawiczbacteria bacterium]|nr:RNA 2',3'-cyclic phosphodiesterase [Candidatus Staskawiczbacteria bacterium]
MEKRHRVFIAINLPEEVKRELFAYSEKFAELPAKWTPKDNLHITLEFLGTLTDEEIGEVCLVAKEVAERHSSFSLNVNQILYGPPKKLPPKMVWAEGEKSEELSLLREDLENSLTEKVKFVPENRTFAPHITLARISSFAWKQIEPEERPEINGMFDLPFDVESIEVMESEMKRGGPVYTILESHNLKL